MPLYTPTSTTSNGNLLVNGAFDYWQAGTTGTVTTTGPATDAYLYMADQWCVDNVLGGITLGIVTYSRVAGTTDGSLYGAKAQITTAPAGGSIDLNGTPVVLFQSLSNKTSLALYNKTASFTVLIKALGNVNSIKTQFYYFTSESKYQSTINMIGSAAVTTVNSSTFTACTINGQALGSSMTTAGCIGIAIWLNGVSSGNKYDLNNGFIAEQAMLNLGSLAGTFRRQYDNPAEELAACQYFYEKSYDLTVNPGTNTGTDSAGGNQARSSGLTSATQFTRMNLPFKVSKRATPTMTGYSTDGTSGKFRDRVNSSNITPTFLTGLNSAVADVTGSASGTTFWFEGHWVADARI